MTAPRALDIWLTASGTLAQAKIDFNAIGLNVVYGDAPGHEIVIYDDDFPDILFRFTSLLSVREAARLIKVPTGPFDTLSKQASPPDVEFFGGTYAELSTTQRKRTLLPISFVDIGTGTDIQGVVDANPAGTTYRLATGTHRNRRVTPKDGDTFVGVSGTIMNGSTLLTSWVVDGSRWRHDGINAPLATFGVSCKTGFRCNSREDIYFNDVPLKRVQFEADVGAGEFATAISPNRVWIGDDPTGQTVEIGTTIDAFNGSAEDVMLRDFTIEKYAPRIQFGAVTHSFGGWTFLNMVFQLNHGLGLSGWGQDIVLGCTLSNNGQMGIKTQNGDDGLILGNEIADNNYAGVDPEFEAGGTKFVKTTDLIARNNCVHDNLGHGLWFDIDNINPLLEHNIVFSNERDGIKYEISYTGKIRNNYAFKNGTLYTGNEANLAGSQIKSQNSPGTIIEDNVVVVFSGVGNGIAWTQANRGSGVNGPYKIVDNQQINNDVTFLGSSGQSGVFAPDDLSGFQSADNTLDDNDYTMPDGAIKHFFSGTNTKKTWTEFLADGFSASGTLTVSQESEPTLSCDG